MKLAINQPYFAPYSGYFSLINSADVFIFYDCIQFTRRGRIHRSQTHQSRKFADGWLTLPIEKMPQETKISDITLKPFAQADYTSNDLELMSFLKNDFDVTPYQNATNPICDFLFQHVTTACDKIGIQTKIIRSSSLQLGDELTGQDRIKAICKKMDATDYINLPGGRALYQGEVFGEDNIRLHFIDSTNCSRFGYLQAQAEGQWDRFLEESQSDLISAT